MSPATIATTLRIGGVVPGTPIAFNTNPDTPKATRNPTTKSSARLMVL